MNYRDTMKTLESLGTAQNRKVYARHGVRDKMYGVSYANLGKLRKQIRIDNDLAAALWKSGNHDARVLATMVADAAAANARVLDEWVRTLDNYVVTDAFSDLAARSSHARKVADKWVRSKQEFVGQAGYGILARLALAQNDLPDSYFAAYIERIEKGIHKSPNRTRHAMNNALIAIGTRSKALEKKAVTAARRIGKVEVDHGETSCTTPDAVSYIAKTAAHRAKKAQRRKG